MPKNDRTPPWSNDPHPTDTGIFEKLRAAEMLLPAGSNEHDRAILLITVCIDNGINDGSQIIAVLVQYGFDKAHIGLWLSKGTYPKKPTYWKKSENGKYQNSMTP